MKTAAKISALFLLVILSSSCSDDLKEIENNSLNTSAIELNANGDDEDDDCKGICNN